MLKVGVLQGVGRPHGGCHDDEKVPAAASDEGDAERGFGVGLLDGDAGHCLAYGAADVGEVLDLDDGVGHADDVAGVIGSSRAESTTGRPAGEVVDQVGGFPFSFGALVLLRVAHASHRTIPTAGQANTSAHAENEQR